MVGVPELVSCHLWLFALMSHGERVTGCFVSEKEGQAEPPKDRSPWPALHVSLHKSKSPLEWQELQGADLFGEGRREA